jgi:hypothetical protein
MEYGEEGSYVFVPTLLRVGNAEVGKIFGGIHYSGVSKASERLREEMTSDKKLMNLVSEIISQFKT